MADAGLAAVVVSLLVGLPLASASTTAMVGLAAAVSALGYSGAQAQIKYWWLRKEPPKAASKKLSASTLSLAS